MNKTHTSAEIRNLHINPPPAAPVIAPPPGGLPSAGTPPASAPHPPPNDLLALIPPALREIRFRSVSFAARLTLEQRALLFSWLANSDHSIEQIRQKVAAPAPAGFGLQVHATTLYRLRKLAENKKITVAVSDAFDTAQDLFTDERGASTAPLREALSLMLYARAVRAAKAGVESAELGRLVTTIAKLERLHQPSRPAHKRSVLPRHLEPAAVPPPISPPDQTTIAGLTPLPAPTVTRPPARNDSTPVAPSLTPPALPRPKHFQKYRQFPPATSTALVPEGASPIAQDFNLGFIDRNIPSPGGTAERPAIATQLACAHQFFTHFKLYPPRKHA